MKKKICVILIAVLVAVLGTSTYFIIDHYKNANKQAKLYQQNGDLVGRISIADTNINYPVIRSVNEPDFYLKRRTAIWWAGSALQIPTSTIP